MTLTSIKSEDKVTLKLPDGSDYEGKVNKNNLPNGKGRIIYKNGDVYTGYFLQGQKNGVGQFEKKGQFVYYGNFSRNKISGIGTMKFEDGRYY